MDESMADGDSTPNSAEPGAPDGESDGMARGDVAQGLDDARPETLDAAAVVEHASVPEAEPAADSVRALGDRALGDEVSPGPSDSQLEMSGVVALIPRPGSRLRGRLWHPDPSLLSGEDARRVLVDIGRARSFLAALEALAVDRIRRACDDEARKAAAVAQRERFDGDVAHALAVSEVGVAEGISEFAATRLVRSAEALCGAQLAVLEGLEGGELTEGHARVITDESSILPDGLAEEFGVKSLGLLETRSGRRRTVAEFRRVVRALRERLHPESIRARKVRAAEDRSVYVRPEPDGMCTLSAFIPAEVGLAAFNRLDLLARAQRDADPEDGRTLPQLRADALSELVLAGQALSDATHRAAISGDPSGGGRPGDAGDAPSGGAVTAGAASLGGVSATAASSGQVSGGAPSVGLVSSGASSPGVGSGSAALASPASGSATSVGTSNQSRRSVVGEPTPSAEIVVVLSAETLLGANDAPATLEGYGPIDAETARDLAVAAPTWQRLYTDVNGVPLALGRSVYRPPKGLRRFIEYRDGTCQFPGCSRAARRSEIDHIVEWQDGGTTDEPNLQALCRKHHALKSLRLWRAERLEPEDGGAAGDIVWVSPLGGRAVSGPEERGVGSLDHLSEGCSGDGVSDHEGDAPTHGENSEMGKGHVEHQDPPPF